VIAFLVDQNFNENIVDGLTRRDPTLDFTHVRDVGLAAAPDPVVLEWAAGRGGRENSSRTTTTKRSDSMTTRTIHRRIHGKTIELDEDPGVAEGQEVEVQVRVISKANRKPGDGFLRTEGALADDTEWDGIMEEIYQARKRDRRTIPDLGQP
jgi:hypothetical protein